LYNDVEYSEDVFTSTHKHMQGSEIPYDNDISNLVDGTGRTAFVINTELLEFLQNKGNYLLLSTKELEKYEDVTKQTSYHQKKKRS